MFEWMFLYYFVLSSSYQTAMDLKVYSSKFETLLIVSFLQKLLILPARPQVLKFLMHNLFGPIDS